jgi:hypothetical protein
VDGLSSKDKQQQASKDEQKPDAEPAMDPKRGGGRGRGRGRDRGRGIAAGRIARKGTTRENAVYFMHDRNPPTNSTFTYGKRLYQEWVVDQYSKVERQRLWWVRLNQTTLRAHQYKGMVMPSSKTGLTSPTLGAWWSFQPLLLVAPAT